MVGTVLVGVLLRRKDVALIDETAASSEEERDHGQTTEDRDAIRVPA